MKAIFNLKKSIYYVAAFAVAVSMASCDDDETDPKPLTTADLIGNYDGKMYVKTLTEPATQATEEKASQAINGKLEETKAVFDNFPVNDFIIAIEGEEVAAEIIEGLKDIKFNYELPFDAEVNDAKDAISLTLKPGTLAFSYTLPAAEAQAEEGEDETGTKKEIVVAFKAVETADTYAKSAVRLNFISESIEVDEVALEGYKAQTVLIELKKQ